MGNKNNTCCAEPQEDNIEILSKTPAQYKLLNHPEPVVETEPELESLPNNKYWETDQIIEEVKSEIVESEKESEKEAKKVSIPIYTKETLESSDYTPCATGNFVHGKLSGFGTMQYENGNKYEGRKLDRA